MGKATSLRLQDVRQVFRLLYESRDLRANSEASQKHLVLGLCDLLGARQGNALTFEGFEKDGVVKLREFVHAGHSTETCRILWEHVRRAEGWRGDPLLNRATDVEGPEQVFARQHLVSDREWYASPCYHQFCASGEIDQALVSWFRLQTRGTVRAFAFNRAPGDKPFEERAVATLRLLNREYRRMYLLGEFTAADGFTTLGKRLSTRMQEVLRRLLAGKSVKEVATEMELSKHTVDDYAKALYRVYGVHSRAELLARFVSRGRW